MAIPKYKLKVTTQYEALRFLAPADFNKMLAEWGEKFQSAADITGSVIKLYTVQGVVNVQIGSWIIKQPDGFFSALTNAEFTATYMKV